MMKKVTIIIILIIIFLCCLFFVSCKEEDDEIRIEKFTGVVQKGPFVKGTEITLHELNTDLVPSGRIFNTQVSENDGSFEIGYVAIKSGLIQLAASGNYFEEIKGTVSTTPITLYALSEVSDQTNFNINVLTHLAKPRIEVLINSKPFAEAKLQAEAEIMAMFGFDPSLNTSFESLDISVDGEANGILLAVSVLIQGNRGVSSVHELMTRIIKDISSDGVLNDKNIKEELRNTGFGLITTNVRSRLQNRYNGLGLNRTIPPFEKYVDIFLRSTGLNPFAAAKQATDITSTSATLNGVVNANDHQTSVTFEYGPTIAYGNSVDADPPIVTGVLNTNVKAVVTGLIPDKMYHFRVKAVNDIGTAYSSDMIISGIDQVKDIDGNTYKTIAIGDQLWMAENLKVTKYRDGSEIPFISDPVQWVSTRAGAQCPWLPENTAITETYGRLYNFYAVTDARNICPTGWHVPSDEEWTTLSNYLISNGYGYGGSGTDIAKALASTSDWTSFGVEGCVGNDQLSNNASGFTALPGGLRNFQALFLSMGMVGSWYSTTAINETDAWFRLLNYNYTEFGKFQNKKAVGASVRCLKD